jgi:hypothetical protein
MLPHGNLRLLKVTCVGEHCNKIAKEKNSSILQFQDFGTDKEDVENVLADVALLKDKSTFVRETMEKR